MITAVLTPNAAVASAFASRFDLAKIPAFGSMKEAYRTGDVVLAVSDEPGALAEIAAEYLPERLYYAALGTSATSERYAGDVVLPNAFIPYAENEGSDEEATFLENYEEQEDYDFETFGLSIGGVCVSAGKELDEETLVKIASEYGADIVDEHGCATIAAGSTGNEFALYPIYGVVDGIVGNEDEPVTEEMVANNMASVFRFLEDTFDDEEGNLAGTKEEDEDDVTDDDHDE